MGAGVWLILEQLWVESGVGLIQELESEVVLILEQLWVESEVGLILEQLWVEPEPVLL